MAPADREGDALEANARNAWLAKCLEPGALVGDERVVTMLREEISLTQRVEKLAAQVEDIEGRLRALEDEHRNR
jgi:hypothetical protein